MRKLEDIGIFALGLLLIGACNNDGPAGAGTGTDGDTETDTEGETFGGTGTDTDTDGEPVDPNPASPAMRELMEATCSLGFRCCSRGEVDYYLGPWVDQASCTDRLFDLATVSPAALIDLAALAGLSDVSLLVPNLAALDQAVVEGRIVVDEEALQACRDHLASVSCNEADGTAVECEPLPPPPAELPCDLQNLFIGQLDEGEVCTSIDGIGLDCAPGLRCGIGLGLGSSGRCVAVKQENEICTASAECGDDLYCSQLDGTCQRLRTAGEVCVFADSEDPNPSPQTLLLGCTEDLSCDPITSTCVARCQSGAACVSELDCDTTQGLSCIAGRCGLPRAEGMPCTVDEDCQADLHCGFDIFDPTSQVCLGPAVNNASCVADDECASEFCHPSTQRCAPQVDVGDPCPSGSSAQCDGGACVQEAPLTTCTSPADCPITNTCDAVTGACGTYCVQAKQDGATCLADSECSSDACIAGFCRTPPLDLGVECETPENCGSGFCSYDSPRVCAMLPLPIGSPCVANAECASGVCFADADVGTQECIAGAEEGELCGDFDRPPCNPSSLYCDFELDTPACAPLHETGEECKSSDECRGECSLRHGRLLCTPAAPEGTAVCDGED